MKTNLLGTSLLLFLAASPPCEAAAPLPALDAEADVSVSGVSSGGAMALQYSVANAGRVAGVGAVAAPPYGCAEGKVDKAIRECMCMEKGARPVSPSPEKTRAAMEPARAQILGQRVKIVTAGKDHTVRPASANSTYQAYRDLYGNEEAAFSENVSLDEIAGAGHGQITEDYPPATGDACSDGSRQRYMLDCDYDAAAKILAHIYAGRAESDPGATPDRDGELRPFDQTEFHPAKRKRREDATSRFTRVSEVQDFADTGYVFIPRRCREAPCPVHVAFHGCKMLEDDHPYFTHSGYNGWAVRHRIIVLYPRLKSDSRQTAEEICPKPMTRHTDWSRFQDWNRNGCWDWWGYGGGDYLSPAAPQIAAVSRMVDRLKERPAH